MTAKHVSYNTVPEPRRPEMALQVTGATKSFGAANTNGHKRWWPLPLGPAAGERKEPDKNKKRVVAVDHVTFQVRRNEIFGILGANGSGKSTLIRLISTLLTPDSGSVSVFGYDVVRDEMAVKRLINRVSVDAAFFKKLSPMENLMYGARLYGLDGDYAGQRIVEILKRLGIQEKNVYAPLEDMSRGMQQKVAIARAFLTTPTLLLLDEPTTGLDPRSKRDVQTFVLEMRQDHGATIVLTTHDMEEADRLCDRIAILDSGRIVAMDTPSGLKGGVPPRDGRAPSMEDVFMQLTGKNLQEDE
jgi:ABC-2 type transport system ATP-binding protein